MESFEPNPQQDPRAAVMAMIQEVSSMGGNDSEVSELRKLIVELNSSQNDPVITQEVLERARDIVESKNPYH